VVEVANIAGRLVPTDQLPLAVSRLGLSRGHDLKFPDVMIGSLSGDKQMTRFVTVEHCRPCNT